ERPKTTEGAPRLAWPSKPSTVERVVLPFQVVETINESHATREAQHETLLAGVNRSGPDPWRNKLADRLGSGSPPGPGKELEAGVPLAQRNRGRPRAVPHFAPELAAG